MSKPLHPKPKRTNVASLIPPFLRGHPQYEPFEMPTLEVILMEDMKNKPGLVRLLNAFVKTGKSVPAAEREVESVEESRLDGNDRIGERRKTLTHFLQLRSRQQKLAIRDHDFFGVHEEEDNLSLKARCRLSLDGLVSFVVKSGRLKIETDENDPSQLANAVVVRLDSMSAPEFSESYTIQLMDDLMSMPDNSFNKLKYRKNLIVMEVLYHHLYSLRAALRSTLNSFKNQRGGWKTDVLMLVKSVKCRKISAPVPTNGECIDIERLEHQVSNLNVMSEIVETDDLDVKISESRRLVSSLQHKRM